MNLKNEPITVTCGNCGRVYECTLGELVDYLDAFPDNDETPCCGQGFFKETELVDYVLQNHVPMCPRCSNQLKWDHEDTVESCRFRLLSGL